MNTACLFFMAAALWRMVARDSLNSFDRAFSEALFYMGMFVLVFAFCDIVNVIWSAA